MVLDIFGEVTAASGNRTSDVKIMTRSRIFDPNQPSGRPFPRETTATVRITPNEVVSVQLPQVADASAFASRALSLRIRYVSFDETRHAPFTRVRSRTAPTNAVRTIRLPARSSLDTWRLERSRWRGGRRAAG